MTSIDIELVLVGLVAMLEPATLVSSMLALVVGRRPLRTGSLFYVGGLGVTLACGLVAALVLGNAAAVPADHVPKTWVLIVDVVIGVALLAYVAWSLRRPADPQRTAANVARIGKLDAARPLAVIAAGAVLANAGIFMLVALKAISQLDPTTAAYALDWLVFSLVSLLPLGLALVLLRLAPGHTMPALVRMRGWIELHARAVAFVIITLLAISLLREGISGLAG